MSDTLFWDPVKSTQEQYILGFIWFEIFLVLEIIIPWVEKDGLPYQVWKRERGRGGGERNTKNSRRYNLHLDRLFHLWRQVFFQASGMR